MNHIQTSLAIWLRAALSLSLAIAPFYGLPAPADTPTPAAAATSTQPDTAQLSTQLLLDLEALLDRALYPDVPRLTAGGLPTGGEMAQVQTRLLALKNAYASSLQTRVIAITQDLDELLLVTELNTYFTAAQKFEGLKIILGQAVTPETWDAQYSLSLDVAALSQLKFLVNSSMLSQFFVSLPGSPIDFTDIAQQQSEMRGFRTRIDINGGGSRLSLRLNPDFAATYDQLALVNNPNTRNVLRYALLWSATRLYDDASLTQMLLRQPVENLPQPSQAMQGEFASLRVKRDLMLQSAQASVFAQQKPQLLKAISDALDNAVTSNRRPELDENFLRTLSASAGLTTTPDQVKARVDQMRQSEFVALAGLINMVDLSDWQGQTQFLVGETIRLTLRWFFLANPDSPELKPEVRAQIAQQIDGKAKEAAAQILSDGVLSQQAESIRAKTTTQNVNNDLRQTFQTNLQAAAAKLQNFTSGEVNLQYLLGAQRPSIAKLNPSSVTQGLVDLLDGQPTYVKAFEKYKEQLVTYMQAFSYANPLPSPVTLAAAFQAIPSGKWNPQALSGLDAKYVSALTAQKDARSKDLNDMMALGKLLKFDVYENLIQARAQQKQDVTKAPSVADLNVKGSWFGSLFTSEQAAYLEEMKKDVYTNAPILGADVGNQSVWQALSGGAYSDSQKFQMIDDQLNRVAGQISSNNADMDAQLQKVKTAADNSLSGVGEELRTLVTRTTQISVGLNSFAGFSSYYDEIRRELLLPGFIGNEWQQFNSWSNTVSLYLIGFWALSALGSRVPLLGRGVDFFARYLAPVFGVNLSRLNLIIMGTVGVSVADTAVEWGMESSRETTLNKFFDCGSAAPCVALYKDVSLQGSLADAQRNQLVLTAALMVGLYVGFKLFGKAASRLSVATYQSRIAKLLPQISNLGLKDALARMQSQVETGKDLQPEDMGIFNADRLKQTTLDERARINRTVTDPLQKEAQLAVVTEARELIEEQVWQESAKWAKLNERFADVVRRLGLDSRTSDWKELSDLDMAWRKLEVRHQNGEISTYDYNDLKQSLANMHQVLQPVYAKMASDALTRAFMQRVWDASSGVSNKQIAMNIAEYKSASVGEFQRAMLSYLGDSGAVRGAAKSADSDPAVDSLIDRMAVEIQKNPAQAHTRFEALLDAFRKRGTR